MSEAVAHAAAVIARQRDITAVAAAIVDQAVSLGARSAQVFLADEASRRLRLIAHRDLDRDLVDRISEMPFDAPFLAARAARTREVAVATLDDRGADLAAAHEAMRRSGARAMVCVPLVTFDEMVGVLTWQLPEPPDSLAVMRAVGEVFAVGIANARAAAEAHAWRTRMRAMLDNAYQFMGLLSLDGTLIEANRSALQFIGRPREEVLGRPFWDTPWWQDDAAARDKLQRAVAEAAAGRFVRFEVEHHGEGGRVATVDFSLTPVRDEAGAVIFLVPEGRDVTDRKARERLHEEWLSVIAHDLRQPVNVMGLLLHSLKRRNQTPTHDFLQTADKVDATIHQLDRLIGDLLDVSRLEANRLSLDRTPGDIGALVRGSLDRFEGALEGHRLEVHVDDGLPTLDMDPGRIDQVLMNLVSNAAKYGDADTPITVSVEASAGGVRVSVSNRGRDLVSDELKLLFGRFARTPAAAHGHTPGIGLGLYIAKGLVEAHGGRVGVDSGDGRTTFFFTLPPTPRPRAGDGTGAGVRAGGRAGGD